MVFECRVHATPTLQVHWYREYDQIIDSADFRILRKSRYCYACLMCSNFIGMLTKKRTRLASSLAFLIIPFFSLLFWAEACSSSLPGKYAARFFVGKHITLVPSAYFFSSSPNLKQQCSKSSQKTSCNARQTALVLTQAPERPWFIP